MTSWIEAARDLIARDGGVVRASLTRGRTANTDKAGPHNASIARNPVAGHVNPASHQLSPKVIPAGAILSRDTPSRETPGPPSRRAARQSRSGVAGASSIG